MPHSPIPTRSQFPFRQPLVCHSHGPISSRRRPLAPHLNVDHHLRRHMAGTRDSSVIGAEPTSPPTPHVKTGSLLRVPLARIRPCNATASCLVQERLKGIRGGLARLDRTGIVGRVRNAVGSGYGSEGARGCLCHWCCRPSNDFLCTFLVNDSRSARRAGG